MIPDYKAPEGWREVDPKHVPTGTEWKPGPVLVRVDPPFDFRQWAQSYCARVFDDQWVCRWDRIEPVAEHVQVRNPWTDNWVVADQYYDVSADAVLEVRPKEDR